jgi:hypothetical protein
MELDVPVEVPQPKVPAAYLLAVGTTPLADVRALAEEAFAAGSPQVLVPTRPARPAPAHAAIAGWTLLPRESVTGSREPGATLVLAPDRTRLLDRTGREIQVAGCPVDNPVCGEPELTLAMVRISMDHRGLRPLAVAGESGATLHHLARVLGDGVASPGELPPEAAGSGLMHLCSTAPGADGCVIQFADLVLVDVPMAGAETRILARDGLPGP